MHLEKDEAVVGDNLCPALEILDKTLHRRSGGDGMALAIRHCAPIASAGSRLK